MAFLRPALQQFCVDVARQLQNVTDLEAAWQAGLGQAGKDSGHADIVEALLPQRERSAGRCHSVVSLVGSHQPQPQLCAC